MHPAVDQLEQAFRLIHRTRMQGLAFVNASLEVEAVGFTDWDGRLLGVLVTPWFMNLMLLPGQGDEWNGLSEGDKRIWRLPCGELELTVGRVDPLGVYQGCPLFSSVSDFPDQAMARRVAEAVMREILAGAARDPGDPRRGDRGEAVSRRELFRRALRVGAPKRD